MFKMGDSTEETASIRDLRKHFERVGSVYSNHNSLKRSGVKSSAEPVKQSKSFSFFNITRSRHKKKKPSSNSVIESTPESSISLRPSKPSAQDSKIISERGLKRTIEDSKAKGKASHEVRLVQPLSRKSSSEPVCDKPQYIRDKNKNEPSSNGSYRKLQPDQAKRTQENVEEISHSRFGKNMNVSLSTNVEGIKNEKQNEAEVASNLQLHCTNDSDVQDKLVFDETVDTQNTENILETFNCDEYRKTIFMEVDSLVHQMQLDTSDLSDTENKEVEHREYSHLSSFVEDDFESHILEQNGENYIVEAFNDIGNELVITYLDITRKSVSLNADFSFDEGVMSPEEEASIVLHKSECGSNYKELLNNDENIPMSYKNVPSQFRNKLVRSSSLECTQTNQSSENSVDCSTKLTSNQDKVGNTEKVDKRSVKSMPSFSGMVDNLKDIENRENCNIGSNDSLVGRIFDCDSVQQLQPLDTHPTLQTSTDNGFENPYEDVPTRRSTVCDNSGNVRIEKYVRISDEFVPDQPKSTTLSRKDSIKRKIDYIVEELVQTEDKYISDLKKVVLDYKPYLERVSATHRPLSGKAAYIFGNIEVIYCYGKQFLDQLKACNGNVDKIGKTFTDFKHMFAVYPLYMKNKANSVRTLKQFHLFAKKRQADLGDRLDLSSYLLTPIQRLGKYILLLEKMLEWQTQSDPNNNLENSSNIAKALKLVRRQMRKGNDSIAIDSIKRCPVDLSMQGSFILTESFQLHKPKKIESTVFLFEKMVVFTVVSPENSSIFVYIGSVYLSDLCIASFETDPTIFHLSDFPKNKKSNDKRYTYILEAKTPKVKETWTHEIEKLLWKQLERVKDQTLKQQSEEGKLLMKIPVKSSSRSKSTSYTTL